MRRPRRRPVSRLSDAVIDAVTAAALLGVGFIALRILLANAVRILGG